MPDYLLTLVVAVVFLLITLAKPMLGVGLMLVTLYFPLLPLVRLGPVEFSVTALPALGLALGALLRSKSQVDRVSLVGWQKGLLVALVLVFLLSSLFTTNVDATTRMLPNLLIYLLILAGIMAEVNTPAKLQSLVKLIVVLAFILSIWRVELKMMRSVLGLSSLSINGAVFNFHPAVFLTLVILLFPQVQAFSMRWRLFAALALISMLIHGIQYETRAAWLTWALVMPVLLSRVSLKGWMRLAPVAVSVVLISASIYATAIGVNYTQARLSIRAGLGQTEYDVISQDDRFRLLIRDAGLRMFQDRPVLGWGANTFNLLKPQFSSSNIETQVAGAFNAWLSLLVEMGLVGGLVGLMVSLVPLGITWFVFRKQKNDVTALAFGFALGVLGLVIHLLFIDLMYSFYWTHVALALAAARLALQASPVQGAA